MLSAMTVFPSFLRLNDIPLCVYYIFFIHSLMNIEVIFYSWLLQIMLQWTWESRYFLEIRVSFPLDICLEGGFLDHMVVLFLIFLRCPHTIFPNYFLIAISVYIPTNSKHQKRFLFLHNLSNVCYLIFFDKWPFQQVGCTSSLRFWFAFPWWLVMLSTFSYTFCHSYVFFGEMCIQVLCLIFFFLHYKMFHILFI